MKCPHCKYVDGWDVEKQEGVNGKEGEFWRIAGHNAERSEYEDVRSIWACPKCGICFIEP